MFKHSEPESAMYHRQRGPVWIVGALVSMCTHKVGEDSAKVRAICCVQVDRLVPSLPSSHAHAHLKSGSGNIQSVSWHC